MFPSIDPAGNSFTPAWWLPGPHFQTAWGRATRSRRQVPMVREALATPDGDTLLLDHLEGPASSPRLLVVHGLEGSSHSVYVQGLLALARRRGWRGTALNFRSCARDPRDLDRMLVNERPRLYHSGETTDFDLVVSTLAAREPDVPLVAVGVSLGGNVVLKWLGENPGQERVAAAAAISTPYDLAAGSRHLETRIGSFYVEHFLKTLRPKALDVVRRFPEAAARIDAGRVRVPFGRRRPLSARGRPAAGPREGVGPDRLPDRAGRRAHRFHRRSRTVALRVLGGATRRGVARGAHPLRSQGGRHARRSLTGRMIVLWRSRGA